HVRAPATCQTSLASDLVRAQNIADWPMAYAGVGAPPPLQAESIDGCRFARTESVLACDPLLWRSFGNKSRALDPNAGGATLRGWRHHRGRRGSGPFDVRRAL